MKINNNQVLHGYGKECEGGSHMTGVWKTLGRMTGALQTQGPSVGF